MAIHTIPSRQEPKPVLMKLKNNNIKTRLMKQRKTMKQLGHKLVDDVTKKNTELISRLLKHEKNRISLVLQCCHIWENT